MLSPLGGLLATKIGGATLFGAGIAINGILSILTPYTIHLNTIFFIFVRLIEGIFQVSSRIIYLLEKFNFENKILQIYIRNYLYRVSLELV